MEGEEKRKEASGEGEEAVGEEAEAEVGLPEEAVGEEEPIINISR